MKVRYWNFLENFEQIIAILAPGPFGFGDRFYRKYGDADFAEIFIDFIECVESGQVEQAVSSDRLDELSEVSSDLHQALKDADAWKSDAWLDFSAVKRAFRFAADCSRTPTPD